MTGVIAYPPLVRKRPLDMPRDGARRHIPQGEGGVLIFGLRAGSGGQDKSPIIRKGEGVSAHRIANTFPAFFASARVPQRNPLLEPSHTRQQLAVRTPCHRRRTGSRFKHSHDMRNCFRRCVRFCDRKRQWICVRVVIAERCVSKSDNDDTCHQKCGQPVKPFRLGTSCRLPSVAVPHCCVLFKHHLSLRLSRLYRSTGDSRSSITRREPVLISTVTAMPGARSRRRSSTCICARSSETRAA